LNLADNLQQAYTQALMDLERAEAKEDTSDDDTALFVATDKDPSLAPGMSHMMNTFLVAEQ
jgi:hypothetical protein